MSFPVLPPKKSHLGYSFWTIIVTSHRCFRIVFRQHISIIIIVVVVVPIEPLGYSQGQGSIVLDSVFTCNKRDKYRIPD